MLVVLLIVRTTTVAAAFSYIPTILFVPPENQKLFVLESG